MKKVFRNVNILDVMNDNVLEEMDLYVEDDKISNIERYNPNKKLNDSIEKFDFKGHYLLPGLIDMHTHLIWSGGADPAKTVEEEGIQLSLLHAVSNGMKNLKAGITTVRDVGSNQDATITLSKAIESGYVDGPRIISSGCSIIMTGGHDPFWGIEADGKDNLVKAVRKQRVKGAKVIKISATGGVYGQTDGEDVGNAELTLDEIKIVCKEAHRFGLKVAAHAISREGIENCVLAGIDTIEHGHYLDNELMNIMTDNNIYWVPTLYTYKQIASGNNVPKYAADKAMKIIDIHKIAFQKSLNKGLKIAAGSDAGSPAGVDHPSLVSEVETMVEYGCDNLFAIKTATINAAEALGLIDILGSIDINKKADFFIVKNNPLEDISSLKEVNLVVKNGEIV